MKKLLAVVALAIMATLAQPALAIERRQVAQLHVDKGELLVQLVETKIELLDVTLAFLDYQLFVLEQGKTMLGTDASVAKTAATTNEAIGRVKAELKELLKRKREGIELLQQARRALEEAKSILAGRN